MTRDYALPSSFIIFIITYIVQLNGTNIRSIQYVSKLGGDPVTEKINSNVKLTFFNDFGCAGSVMGATQGNQASLSGIDGAKSVKITCGNEGSGAVSEPCDDKPVVETIVPVVIESEVPCDDETVVETIVPESTHGIPPVVATGNPDPAVPCDKNETIVATTDPSYGAVPATITTIEPNYGASGDAAQAFAQDVNALPVGADPNAAKGATAVSENPKSSAAGLTVSMAGGITAFVMSLML